MYRISIFVGLKQLPLKSQFYSNNSIFSNCLKQKGKDILNHSEVGTLNVSTFLVSFFFIIISAVSYVLWVISNLQSHCLFFSWIFLYILLALRFYTTLAAFLHVFVFSSYVLTALICPRNPMQILATAAYAP